MSFSLWLTIFSTHVQATIRCMVKCFGICSSEDLASWYDLKGKLCALLACILVQQFVLTHLTKEGHKAVDCFVLSVQFKILLNTIAMCCHDHFSGYGR